MNHDPKTEMDELFSAYLDDALTQRQQTELKRLLQHQPEIVEQLRQLRRQRELLCSLPIETAPPTLADDIKARLERQQILDRTPQARSLFNRAGLLRRRLTAAAAMLFLPMALLGYVVWTIVMPATDGPQPRTTAQSLLDDETPPVAVSRPDAPETLTPLPFDGILVLTTDRPILTAQSIEKQIFLQSLEHQTIPNRTAERVTFQIECPAESLADFIDSLKPLWAQITDGRLTLQDADAPDRPLTVPHIRPEQIQTLVRHTDKTPMRTAARQYASANVPLRPGDQSFDRVNDETTITPEQLTIPQPILAWPQQSDTTTPTAQPHVQLLIEVRRPE